MFTLEYLRGKHVRLVCAFKVLVSSAAHDLNETCNSYTGQDDCGFLL